MLAQAGCKVTAVDGDPGAISVARTHYNHPAITHVLANIEDAEIADNLGIFDAVVCFEVLEHLEGPAAVLKSFRRVAPRLLCSVPNEEVMPFEKTRPLGHLRHYTPGQFANLLVYNWHSGNSGAINTWHQKGKESPVMPGWEGRTLIADIQA